MAASMVLPCLSRKLPHISRLCTSDLVLKHTTYCVITYRNNTSDNRPKRRSGSAVPDDVQKWKKLDWRSYAMGKLRVPTQDSQFDVLLIPGHSALPHQLNKRAKAMRPPRKKKQPRYMGMATDQDWTDVWPAAETFKWSVVPFPVRQGYVKRHENDGIPPGKYANVELMKIPNFLHLTPAHIKKHCAAIKQFCTPWPDGLETDEQCRKHFPVEVTTRSYVFDGPSLRDPRARFVTLQVHLADLELDDHAKDKIKKVAGDRYDAKTDILTIEADRCPLMKQNYDYTQYLLTALYHESWKKEPWEIEQQEADMIEYDWELTRAKQSLVTTVKQITEVGKDDTSKLPEPLKELPATPSEEDIIKSDVATEYKEALTDLFNHGEDIHTLNKYKKATKKLLVGL